MKIIFAFTIALLIVLIGGVILLGPKQTETSIKSLFSSNNYYKSIQTKKPTVKKRSNLSNNALIKNDKAVLGVTRTVKDLRQVPPLLVPTRGIAPRANFLFTGPLEDGKHEGIDIWTNPEGKGKDGLTFSKGNPVYSSCNGQVRTIVPENGDVSVICDKLDEIYEDILPSRKIKVLYGHMGDAVTKENYIYVKEGERVKKGQLIGHQGNLCIYAAQNMMVHLHFGIYDISKYPQVPLNPEKYIGVSCTTLNQNFFTDFECHE